MVTMLLILAGTSRWAGPVSAPQQAVRARYDAWCEAAQLKFVDGMFSIRSLHYKAFGSDGKPVDL